MIFLEVGLLAIPDQAFNITLNQQNCSIRVYELADNQVYMDLYIADEEIATGLRCCANAVVLQSESDKFVGNFIFITDDDDNPQIANFEDSTKLIYYYDE